MLHDPARLRDTAPLHDPAQRELLTRCDGWEVRTLAERDFRYAYFAKREMLHLQLWRPAEGVSVLTPSRLTGGRWELYAGAVGKLRVPSRTALEQQLVRALGLHLPNPTTIAGLEFWFVRLPSGSVFDIEIRANA